MSGSSSGSWSRDAPPGDIIDLDRFMRTARPTRRDDDRQLTRAGQLVVDGGSLARKPSALSSASSARPRDKRYSHDSGLSDTSYARKRHRPHRRVSCAGTARREARDAPPRAGGSAASLRAFRVACERALRDQQQAITRVAQLCQRLSERQERPTPTADSSEVSSSSRSTRDQRRKDKHRTEECKTYKIIMTKLDELYRLFATRGEATRGPSPLRRTDPALRVQRAALAPRGRRARDTPSSVSVSDKLVATEPVPETVLPVAQQSVKRAARVGALHTITNAAELDIAPARADCPNVRTESVVLGGASAGDSSTACAAGGFDLDNPVRLYAQAKRLQALHATTHVGGLRGGGGGAGGGAEVAARAARRAWGGCVRALRHCLAAPLCCPGAWS